MATLALAIHPEEPDLAALRLNGWQLVDPRQTAGTPAKYRRFVGGWRRRARHCEKRLHRCSNRLVQRPECLLPRDRSAGGLAHDTGFGAALPTGEGLLTFNNDEGIIIAGLELIDANYTRHRQAARAIAERLFDSDLVLTHLLDRVGATS